MFYVFLSSVCYAFVASVYLWFVVTCWERADLLVRSRLWYLTVSLSLYHFYPGSGVVLVSIPDLCTLTYFVDFCFKKIFHDNPFAKFICRLQKSPLYFREGVFLDYTNHVIIK